jgi:hypothetical protein
MAVVGSAWAAGLRGVPAAAADARAKLNIRLGLDNFAVRAFGWKAPELIDYAASLKTDSLFISDLGPFERRDDAYLKDLRKIAADKGLQIQLGSGYLPRLQGIQEGLSTPGISHLASAWPSTGPPVFRVILGTREDRKTEGGIEAHRDTVQVLKVSVRAIDAEVKIAVKIMRATCKRELVTRGTGGPGLRGRQPGFGQRRVDDRGSA